MPPRVPESFSEPIPLPKGKPLVTLRDAAQAFNHPGDRHDPHCRTSFADSCSIAGVLILILPSLLNYVVAVYLIVVGLIGLNGIYHFIN